jgi:hypothetical protein
VSVKFESQIRWVIDARFSACRSDESLPSTRSIAGMITITDILKTGMDANTIGFTIGWNVATIVSTIALVTAITGDIVRFTEKLDGTTASFMIGDAVMTDVVLTDAGR